MVVTTGCSMMPADCMVVQVPYVPEGLEAIIFTADGDMRQALNNLQVKLHLILGIGDS